MNDTEKILPLRFAKEAADHLVEILGNACLRLEVAGAVRRLRPSTPLVELLAIPKLQSYVPADFVRSELFETRPVDAPPVEHNFLWEAINAYTSGRALSRGEKVREFKWLASRHEVDVPEEVPVRITICDRQNWGLILMRCTGSELFVKHVHASLRRASFVAKGGRVWHGLGKDLEPISEPISVPEEEDLFRLAKMKHVPPAQRSW